MANFKPALRCEGKIIIKIFKTQVVEKIKSRITIMIGYYAYHCRANVSFYYDVTSTALK